MRISLFVSSFGGGGEGAVPAHKRQGGFEVHLQELCHLVPSPQALWPVVGRQERDWGTRLCSRLDFCGKTIQSRYGQQIAKLCFSINFNSLYNS